MDKLKALHYFLAAAQTGSLSAAARQQGVSLQAVAKLVGALEAQLGATLFQRGSRGLTLTADGLQYAEACAPLLAQLQAADDGLRQARQRPQGTLVVGGTPFFLQHCIVPALHAFHDNYPDLTLDLRAITHLDEAAARDCDLLVLHGWFEAGDRVRRELPVMPQVTVATPAYWQRHGIPRHPSELAGHNCLCYRNPYGKLLDLWRYRHVGQVGQVGQAGQQGEVIEQVIVRGWLHSNHRDNLVELALGDGGVIRAAPATVQVALASGRLAPVLLDWEMMDPPPLAIYFRPELRRTQRLRVFADFVVTCCTELAQLTSARGQSSVDGRPAWHHGSGRRASSWLTHR
ncbi:transcriptional regulator, LysR family [Leptothrix cholodnii SP-6]|uniref:Transcriptional regulator, LysR family n=1 Tax=Leptothrix cholodnii (strain ATCC 51168 / LMG 8142 / SP-6) TaxID=395495 RepID=B1Y680_LEPCP|nr:LysR family transcriptional regulator [Leptothrix cholodnii]ACB33585.1 transcriptional regulator, LysR family [Leptothrix cholodnii SP-6]